MFLGMNDAETQKVHTSGEFRLDFDQCESLEIDGIWFVKFSLKIDSQIKWLKSAEFEKGVS